jgi:hypothetical protein
MSELLKFWPDELTPELSDILGRQCFMFIKLARAYRAAGVDIPTQAEAEQAYFLHRMLCHWFEHGEGWRDAMTAEITEMAERARTQATLLSKEGDA